MTDILVVEFNVADVDESWTSLVSAGIQIVEAHDRNRWALGDLGLKVERNYGEESLGKYANEILIRPKTMYDYASVSGFYSDDYRAMFPSLSWSHYRVAMGATDLEDAIEWLVRAADEGLNVDQLDALIKGKPSRLTKKVTDFDARMVEQPDGTLAIQPLAGADMSRLKPGEVYLLKVYRYKTAEEMAREQETEDDNA